MPEKAEGDDGQSATTTMLNQSPIETPLGTMIAIADCHALYFLQFADQPDTTRNILRLERKNNLPIIPGTNAIINAVQQEITNYFNGTLKEFSTPITVQGTPFEQTVWHALRSIKYGNTQSYADVATVINRPSAYRAVANANGANQITIIVPCHRIIKSNGELCGYNGGIERKQWLINHENRSVSL